MIEGISGSIINGIFAFVEKKSHKRVTNIVNVFFNISVQGLKYDRNLLSFVNVMISSLLYNNKSMKFIIGERITKKVALL